MSTELDNSDESFLGGVVDASMRSKGASPVRRLPSSSLPSFCGEMLNGSRLQSFGDSYWSARQEFFQSRGHRLIAPKMVVVMEMIPKGGLR